MADPVSSCSRRANSGRIGPIFVPASALLAATRKQKKESLKLDINYSFAHRRALHIYIDIAPILLYLVRWDRHCERTRQHAESPE